MGFEDDDAITEASNSGDDTDALSDEDDDSLIGAFDSAVSQPKKAKKKKKVMEAQLTLGADIAFKRCTYASCATAEEEKEDYSCSNRRSAGRAIGLKAGKRAEVSYERRC